MTKENTPERIAYNTAVGERLRAIRGAVDLSQTKLAASFGEKQNTYQKWEKGENAADPHAIFLLSQKYRIPFDFIYAGDLSVVRPKSMANDLARRLGEEEPFEPEPSPSSKMR